MSRSLNVPGSPSSELHTRYLAPGKLPRHEAPLEAGRETRAAAAAQRRFLDFGDDLLRRNFFAQDFLQRRIAAARLVVLQAPVGAVDALHDDGVGAEQIGGERRDGQAHYLNSSISWSSLSGVIAHAHALVVDEQHRRVAAGAHALAFLQREARRRPWFRRSRCRASASGARRRRSRPCSAHGRLVQIVSLCLPTGFRSYMV